MKCYNLRSYSSYGAKVIHRDFLVLRKLLLYECQTLDISHLWYISVEASYELVAEKHQCQVGDYNYILKDRQPTIEDCHAACKNTSMFLCGREGATGCDSKTCCTNTGCICWCVTNSIDGKCTLESVENYDLYVDEASNGKNGVFSIFRCIVEREKWNILF